ncbi:MAG: cation:proton antiporter [Nannocystaceae bacterium]|nr:cation:proton antiporter [Nannocystaceae bacterium]
MAIIHDPLTRFIAQAVAILLLSRALGLLARRIGQPLVVAEIAAGILLGPSLFGLIAPETYAVVFEPTSLGLLGLVSQLGLILFMFLVGLELDPGLLAGRAHSSVAISHTSIIVPFGLGAAIAPWLHSTLAPEGVSLLPFTLFLGAAMSVTAFPVLARILSERRLVRSRVGAITIACAAVDDVTAWCLLAFVVATARATGASSAVITTLCSAAYVLVMFFLVRPLLGRIAARVGSREALTQNLVAVVLLCLLLSSWTTELLGIHGLFGAFLFGAVLPKQGGLAHALAEKLEDVVLVVLLPLFFAFSGVRTQIGLVDSPQEWLMCGVIVLVACAGKFGGSTIAARVTGMSWRESSAIGVLMNTRGLMELVVLNIGLELGVISPTLFTMMVIMALVTTFVTSPLLQRIYPAEQLAKDLIGAGDSLRVPTPTRRFATLVCVANERSGPGLVTIGEALRGPDRAEPTYALHLMSPTDRASFFVGQAPEEVSARILAPALERARALSVAIKPISFVSSDPAADICGVAGAKGIDLMLLGWHKPLLGQSLLGGIVHDVLDAAPCDVGVFIDRGLVHVRRVLVPFVGGQHDDAALAVAQRLLVAGAADITVLQVESGTATPGPGVAAVERLREQGGGRVTLRVVEHASPAEAALTESRAQYDLLVVGLGPQWGLAHRRLGVHAERLIDGASCSVLVTHAGPERRARLDPSHDALERGEA